jgi:ureidoacrylate peracid hydrolase
MKTETPALLVIDVQKIYTEPGSELFCPDSEKTVERINQLIQVFSRARNPIFFIRHMHARDGSDLGRMFDFAGPAEGFNFKEGSQQVKYSPSLKRPRGAAEIIKHRYSAFQGTDLHKQLRELKVTRVAICGFMTNFCCDTTARAAHDRDYFVNFVTDATGCPDLPGMPQDEIRRVVSTLLGAGFATVVSTSDYFD